LTGLLRHTARNDNGDEVPGLGHCNTFVIASDVSHAAIQK